MSPQAIQRIPDYLRPYIVGQDPLLYTPIDHASWRFILKLSHSFFAEHAHQKYLSGLAETGISLERIPLISEMDTCLKRFGWRAVAVSGFIPPGVFMEFLSLGVLPIACDMRSLEHLSYTPAPDIVHEAAGHAPIVADEHCARLLKSDGEISRKAIYSAKDMDVYSAIRGLSDIKEDPRSTPEQIRAAQTKLEQAGANVDYVSEATQLSRMGWWTFEYGLVGSMDQPKIYGAGLLSSIGESFHCLGPEVKKVPFSLECVDIDYDITRPQPQLFVAKNFTELTEALDRLADHMAFRIGGVEGLYKARLAHTVVTVELDSGVQASGILVDFQHEADQPSYLQFKGPTQLACGDVEFPDQGADYHQDGFGTPVGLLSDGRSPSELQESDLKAGAVTFQSGVEVRGKFKSLTRKNDMTLIVSFTDCTVKMGGDILFRPEWGVFDMICGGRVVSVFGGAADRGRYLAATGGFRQEPGQQKTNLTAENKSLNELYSRLRKLRENAKSGSEELEAIHGELERVAPRDGCFAGKSWTWPRGEAGNLATSLSSDRDWRKSPSCPRTSKK